MRAKSSALSERQRLAQVKHCTALYSYGKTAIYLCKRAIYFGKTCRLQGKVETPPAAASRMGELQKSPISQQKSPVFVQKSLLS